MDAITHARMYATNMHGAQRYGVLPYTHHLYEVELVLREFGPLPHDGELRPVHDPDGPTVEDMIVSAWLHDVVEDTDAKERDIEELFGDWPRRLVAAVTSEEAPNRRTRVALTLPKTRAAGVYAVRLKLADRIANVRNGGGSLRMYAKEQDEFRRGLHTPGENEDMWSELDRLFKGVSK